ncbi:MULTISPECIES: DoxX family protein [unclassified Luteococcus]|uniref:DoxX family protein n=1 Tax=unclassified Luteococcus TaxID=2639923 RepID=UPI00313F0C6B
MNLTRAAGRTMLASFFVVNGAKAAAKPDALVADAEPIARKVVPLVQQVAPPSVANYVPEETKTLVRATGVAQVLGGLGLATGLGRRLSAGLLGASMVPHVLASRPAKGATAEERTAARSVMLRNVALLGAALIASQDTQGKPSLGYRANKQVEALSREVSQQKKQLEKSAAEQKKQLAKTAKQQKKEFSKVSKKTQKDANSQAQDIADTITGLFS